MERSTVGIAGVTAGSLSENGRVLERERMALQAVFRQPAGYLSHVAVVRSGWNHRKPGRPSTLSARGREGWPSILLPCARLAVSPRSGAVVWRMSMPTARQHHDVLAGLRRGCARPVPSQALGPLPLFPVCGRKVQMTFGLEAPGPAASRSTLTSAATSSSPNPAAIVRRNMPAMKSGTSALMPASPTCAWIRGSGRRLVVRICVDDSARSLARSPSGNIDVCRSTPTPSASQMRAPCATPRNRPNR